MPDETPCSAPALPVTVPRTRNRLRHALAAGALALLATTHLSCRFLLSGVIPEAPFAPSCGLIHEGYGSAGRARVRVELVTAGLRIPWSIAFLPDGDMLVTERPGTLRRVHQGRLMEEPVARVAVSQRHEEGLLGVALHPQFATNRLIYLYYTRDTGDRRGTVNRLERYTLSPDGTRAEPERILLDDIPGGSFHNGGRLRIGPDGMLYVSTGDARDPMSSQDLRSLAGKILRITPEGEVPSDNPIAGSRVYVFGVRSSAGFDWLPDGRMVVADHGPSGELFRSGRDEVNLVRPGDNLGWPLAFGCEARSGIVAPVITWTSAVPPGGAAVYTGDAIPEWRGSFLVASLLSRHLHRVVFTPQGYAGPPLAGHEVYLQGDPPRGYGRLRDAIMGPDRQLYVTTSNCDGRAECPPDGDRILRITR